MFSVFFGQYLLNKDVLSANTLSKFLELSKSTKIKIGVLAINSGLMVADSVNSVNNAQGKVDKRFGEIAIEEGFLTEPELKMLLSMQNTEHLKLTQTLVDENILTLNEVEFYLNEYKNNFSLSDEKFEQLKDGKAKVIIDAYLNFGNDPFADLYKEYISLFYKSITRFIDQSVYLEQLEIIENRNYEVLLKQEIVGAKRIYTGFAAETNVLKKFASRFADETFTSLDDYAQDALGEFLNLNNGLYLVNLSNYGVELSLNIQSLHKNYSITANKVYCIPLQLSFGRVDLLISLNPIG